MENLGIKPLADRIIIKKVEEKTTEGGLIIPITDNDYDNKTEKGIVVAVGSGKYENNKIITPNVKINDNVIFNKFSGNEINYKGNYYIITKEENIIAIIE